VEAARTIPRYNIAIVDRQGDVFVVTNTFYKLEVCRDDLFGETNTDYRLTLPYAPPLFGSGKTALAINYLTLLDSFGVDWVASQKSLPGLSPEQFLERMKKACFLYVDLSFLRGMPPDERNLEWAVWYLIIEAACTKVALPVPDPVEVHEELQMHSAVFIEKIRALLGLPPDQYLLVGFDEVGVFHLIHSLFGFDDSSDLLGPFNDFFGIVRKFCKRPHFFPIIVGRSEGISIRNHVDVVSKILLKFIPLSTLDQAS